MSNAPRLQCILTSDEKDLSSGTSLWFQQEEGKKSSFLLNLNENNTTVEAPVHAFLQCVNDNQIQVPFLFGGLELVSNSRNVEVYTVEDESGKETYMKTCRGIVYDQSCKDILKCVIVANGGPRLVHRVHLKLLSLRPAQCTRATLQLMKLKGRLPQEETTTSAQTTTTTKNDTPATTTTPAPPPAVSQQDVGSAMAAISMMVRMTETRLLQNVNSGLQGLETSMSQKFVQLEQSSQQRDGLLLQQQQETIQSQNVVLEELKQNQCELMSMVKGLREELQEVRQELKTIKTISKTEIATGDGETSDGKEVTHSMNEDSGTPDDATPKDTSVDSADESASVEHVKQRSTSSEAIALTESNNGLEVAKEIATAGGETTGLNVTTHSDSSTPKDATPKDESIDNTDESESVKHRNQSSRCSEAIVLTKSNSGLGVEEDEESQGNDATEHCGGSNTSDKESETVQSMSDNENSDSLQPEMEDSEPRQSVSPAQVEPDEESPSAAKEASHPSLITAGPNIIQENGSTDCSGAQVQSSDHHRDNSDVDEPTPAKEKDNAAMNPVPENHWSLVEGDLLGLEIDASDGK